MHFDSTAKKDLLVQSRFRNNILWQLMDGKTATTVSRSIGVSNIVFGNLLNLRMSPFSRKLEDGSSAPVYLKPCLEISKFFRMLPEDLFPMSLYVLHLPKSIERIYSSVEVLPILAAGRVLSTLPSPESMMIESQASVTIKELLRELTPREEGIIKMRFGLGGEDECTLDEVGERYGISSERVRMLEARALRLLRHPKRSSRLAKACPWVKFPVEDTLYDTIRH